MTTTKGARRLKTRQKKSVGAVATANRKNRGKKDKGESKMANGKRWQKQVAKRVTKGRGSDGKGVRC